MECHTHRGSCRDRDLLLVPFLSFVKAGTFDLPLYFQCHNSVKITIGSN